VSTTQTSVTYWRQWLPLAATVLVTGLLARAQAIDTTPSASDTNAPASKDAQVGNIIGKVNAGKGISVVWVEAALGMTLPKPAKPFTVSQKNLRFEPHILAVPVGAAVDFQNGDTVQHNIFWPAISGNKKLGHTLGTWPKGQKRAFEFNTPGIVPLLCNVHPEMSAYVIVTPTPYLAQTDESGNFRIPAVPDGSYTVTAWHEGYKSQTKPVTVASDAKVEFTLAK
jgi:plastocyanin